MLNVILSIGLLACKGPTTTTLLFCWYHAVTKYFTIIFYYHISCYFMLYICIYVILFVFVLNLNLVMNEFIHSFIHSNNLQVLCLLKKKIKDTITKFITRACTADA